MGRKSFIEEELEREFNLKSDESASKFSKLVDTIKKFLCQPYSETSKEIIAAKNADRLGIAYSTLPDYPQKAGMIVIQKITSTEGDELEVPIYFM